MLLIQDDGPQPGDRQKERGARSNNQTGPILPRQFPEHAFPRRRTLIAMKKIQWGFGQGVHHVTPQLAGQGHFRRKQKRRTPTLQTGAGKLHVHGRLAAAGDAKEQMRAGLARVQFPQAGVQRFLLRGGQDKFSRAGRRQKRIRRLAFRRGVLLPAQFHKPLPHKSRQGRRAVLAQRTEKFPPRKTPVIQQEVKQGDLPCGGGAHAPGRIGQQNATLRGGGVLGRQKEVGLALQPGFSQRAQFGAPLFPRRGHCRQILQRKDPRLSPGERTQTRPCNAQADGQHAGEDLPGADALAQSHMADQLQMRAGQQGFPFQRPDDLARRHSGREDVRILLRTPQHKPRPHPASPERNRHAQALPPRKTIQPGAGSIGQQGIRRA